MKSLKKYLAELIGTMVLVVFGCGVAGASGCTGTFNTAYVGTALAFGLAIVSMAYSIGNVSGCHINPAVSLAMLITKRMSVKDFLGYVIAQFIGGFIGAGFLTVFLGQEHVGANALYNGDTLATLIIEVMLTFVFVLVILGVTSRKSSGNFAGLAIGGALTMVHLLGIYFTGTSVNPARSFGPAFFSCTLEAYPMFFIGPMVGAVIAALVWMLIDTKEED